MGKLTPREQKILEVAARLWREQGIPPTLQEIGNVVGIGTRAGVYHHIQSLERKGYVSRGPGRRSLRLLRREEGLPVPPLGEAVSIPRYDRVRGGGLDLARPEVEEFISVPKDWLGGAASFAVRVVGDSMYPTLMNGDLAVVRSQATALNQDIVVALVEDEATVKRFRLARGSVLLVPDNPDHKTLEFPGAKRVKILGKVVRGVRFFS